MAGVAYDLLWGQDLAGQITNQVTEAVKTIRLVRPLIPVATGQMAYAKTVPDTTINDVPAVAGVAPAAVAINAAGTLPPIRFSRSFVVRREQFGDLETISQLAINAGYNLTADEDALLLFGVSAPANGWGATDEGTIEGQPGLLLGDPPALPAEIPQNMNVVTSTLNAITALRADRHFGPFCVVLSPNLHQDAFTPLQGQAVPRIAPILPQLRQDGVQFSPFLPGRRGVVFSTGKAAIDLVIPWDLHVECRDVDVKGDATFVVVEQCRLRINVANSRVALV